MPKIFETLEKIAIAESKETYSIFKYYSPSETWNETTIPKDIKCLEYYVMGLIEGSGKIERIINGIPVGTKAVYAKKSLPKKEFENLSFFMIYSDLLHS